MANWDFPIFNAEFVSTISILHCHLVVKYNKHTILASALPDFLPLVPWHGTLLQKNSGKARSPGDNIPTLSITGRIQLPASPRRHARGPPVCSPCRCSANVNICIVNCRILWRKIKSSDFCSVLYRAQRRPMDTPFESRLPRLNKCVSILQNAPVG